MQQLAWWISLVFVLIVVLVFLFVTLKSGQRAEDYTPIQTKGNKIRKAWIIAVSVILLAGVIIGMAKMPYDKPIEAAGNEQIVDVAALQFAFEMSSDKLKAGQTIAFRVTSKDVNHGFGIYDANGTLLAQTQAMPGYVNTVHYKFDKPGKYKILCLEYCGLAHHYMVSEFEVVSEI